MAKQDLEFPVGMVLAGRFRIIRRLGAGGIGAVYEVEHTLTRHRRALKLLHPRFRDQPQVVLRFQREATAAGRIGNPHIVEAFDAGELDDGAPWLLMELLVGQPLSEVLRENGRLGFAQACDWLAQVASTLQAAHDAGIVHRDLKPDNLFVASLDGRPFLKVLDFGMSKFTLGDEDGPGLTATGMTLGTPLYMAPEQMRGAKAVDARADLYSLGVILYECLAGGVPYFAPNLPTLSPLVFAGGCARVETLRPETPPALADLVHRALAVDPARRVQTAREFADALRAIEGASPAARSNAGASDDVEVGDTQIRPVARAGASGTAASMSGSSRTAMRAARAPEDKRSAPDSRAAPAVHTRPSILDGAVLPLLGAVLLFVVAVVVPIFEMGDGLDAVRAEIASDRAWRGIGIAFAAFLLGCLRVALNARARSGPVGRARLSEEHWRWGLSAWAVVSLLAYVVPGLFVQSVAAEPKAEPTVTGPIEVHERSQHVSAEVVTTPLSGRSVDQPKPTNGGGQGWRPSPSIDTKAEPQAGGTVRFVVKPWASVRCGALKLGDTPFADKQLPAGQHECVFTNPDFPEQRKSIEVKPNETVRIDVSF